MKFGVITFPGSNCDMDMVYALESKMNQTVERLWHKDSSLKGVDAVIVPGGFSYGDYLRSGAIARFSPIMKEVVQFANKGGLVFGVCNGFQILCEAGLLDGTLLHNNQQKFICKNVFLKSTSNNSLLNTLAPKDQALKIPIAHGEGRFFADNDTIKKLEDNDNIIYKYCDENGIVNDASNPNGSILNIAGICNDGKNVYGMMPHPERAADKELGNTDGLYILEGLLNTVNA
jgi:phosphoribosylformylglycinamidine synthase